MDQHPNEEVELLWVENIRERKERVCKGLRLKKHVRWKRNRKVYEQGGTGYKR